MTLLKLGARGESMLIDLFFAVLIFLLIGGSLTWAWTNKAKDSESNMYENELRKMNERAIDLLITSPGNPTNWEGKPFTELETIGFAKRAGLLDKEKVNKAMEQSVIQNIPGLSALWKFEDETGGVAADSSGAEQNGTLYPLATGPVWETADCSLGNCLIFDGVDDYVEDADGENYLNGLTSLTVSVWIKADAIGVDRAFIGSGSTTKDGGFSMRYDSDGVEGGQTNVIKVGFGKLDVDLETSFLESSADKQTTNWQHVVATWQANDAPKLYIDGVLDAHSFTSANGSIISSTTAFWVGNGSKGFWDGSIDEVKIYDRALTGLEIADLAAGTDVPTELVSHWDFDEGTGGLATDAVGGNYGTLQPGPPVQLPEANCIVGNCLSFDGTEDYIDIGNAAAFTSLAEGTISAWIYVDDNPANTAPIFGVSNDAGTDNYARLALGPGPVLSWSARVNSLWPVQVSANAVLNLDEWYHVAVTVDGSGNKLYINGDREAVTYDEGNSFSKEFLNYPLNTNSARIGNLDLLGTTWDRFFSGRIDELAIYNRALTSNEITKIYDNGVITGSYRKVGQKLLIGANDYYFRLIDPTAPISDNIVKNDEGQAMEFGKNPKNMPENATQSTARRPVVLAYKRKGETEAVLHEAIAELTLFSTYRRP